MFAALSKCASMHPDLADGGDVEGQFDDILNDPNHEWITSDSMQGQFEDAEIDTPETNGEGEVRKWRRTS